MILPGLIEEEFELRIAARDITSLTSFENIVIYIIDSTN
jgi:hypothetical protein